MVCTQSKHHMQTKPGQQDNSDKTSEGLLIFGNNIDFTGNAAIAPGVLVRAEGAVDEFRFRTSDGLRVTQVVVTALTDVIVCDGMLSYAAVSSQRIELSSSRIRRPCSSYPFDKAVAMGQPCGYYNRLKSHM
jgi:hypothetical protein